MYDGSIYQEETGGSQGKMSRVPATRVIQRDDVSYHWKTGREGSQGGQEKGGSRICK